MTEFHPEEHADLPCSFTMKISSRGLKLLIYIVKRNTKTDGMGPLKIVTRNTEINDIGLFKILIHNQGIAVNR